MINRNKIVSHNGSKSNCNLAAALPFRGKAPGQLNLYEQDKFIERRVQVANLQI